MNEMKKFYSFLITGAMLACSISTAFAADGSNPADFLKGREDGLALESNVTRAEALTMVLRAEGKEEEALNFEFAEAQYEAVNGEFVSKEDDGIIIKTTDGELKINTANAIFRGYDINEAKEGNYVSAVVSKIRTRSIPPITNAYLVVISDMTSVTCVNVEHVEKNDDAILIWEKDGMDVVVASEKTLVSPYRTRNIMSIDDISVGDRIFVLADIMTMSIPAKVIPNEIIVFENEFEKEDIIYDDTKGHWAENIIGYSIVNGYTDIAQDGSFDPEEEVGGKEFATMLLANIKGESVTDENVYELAKENGLLSDENLDKLVKENKKLTRLDAAKLCMSVKNIVR